MHPHEVEFQIDKLTKTDNPERVEHILFELNTYSGKFSEDQLSKISFAVICSEEILNSSKCKEYLKLILNKNKENMDELQYMDITSKLES